MKRDVRRVSVITIFLFCCIPTAVAKCHLLGPAVQEPNKSETKISKLKITLLSTMLVGEPAGFGEWGFSALVEADRTPRQPNRAQLWKAFLANHREAIAAMDFFTVPTLTFGVLYCFFVIAHDRRRILHLNAMQHPTSARTSQQLREAFPYDCAPKYLIFDRASNFDGDVIDTIKSLGIQTKRTSFRSP
jgi:hypothetical protein